MGTRRKSSECNGHLGSVQEIPENTDWETTDFRTKIKGSNFLRKFPSYLVCINTTNWLLYALRKLSNLALSSLLLLTGETGTVVPLISLVATADSTTVGNPPTPASVKDTVFKLDPQLFIHWSHIHVNRNRTHCYYSEDAKLWLHFCHNAHKKVRFATTDAVISSSSTSPPSSSSSQSTVTFAVQDEEITTDEIDKRLRRRTTRRGTEY